MPVGSGQLQNGGEFPSGGDDDAVLHVGSSVGFVAAALPTV